MQSIVKRASLFFFLLVILNSFAQDKAIDSLKMALRNPKLHDTTRLQMIHNFARTKFTNDFDPKFHQVVDMLGELALKNYNKNNNPKLQKSYTTWLATYYSSLGTRYLQKEEYGKSALYYDKAIVLYRSMKAYDDLYTVYLKKSGLYKATNEIDKQIALIFEALKFYEKDKKNYVHSLYYVYTTLAYAYRHQNEYEKAVQYSQEAIKYCDLSYAEYPSPHTLNWKASNYQNMAYCNNKLKKYKEALESSYKSLEITKKIGADVQTSLTLSGAADMQMKLGNFAEAEKLFQEMLEMKSNSTDDMSKAAAYYGLGSISFNQGDLKNAEDYQEKAFELSKKTTNKTLQKDIAEMLYKINLSNKNYEKALQYYEFNKKITDSTQVESSKKQITEQQLKYEFEKKELQQKIIQEKKLSEMKLDAEKKSALQKSRNELAQQQLKYDFEKEQLEQKLAQGKKLSALKLENERKTTIKNNWLFALSGTLLLLLLLGYFYYRNNKQKQAITILEKDQIKQKLLVTQMNPHFIFNSIDNIQGLIHSHKDDEAVNYLTKFSKLTRQILENSNENYISLAEEIEMTTNYLSIQQLLYDNKFTFNIQIDHDVDQEFIFLPPMLTQPFIENAIKHGLSNTSENGKIDIHFFLKENKLFFEVTDNGKGFDSTQKSTNHKSLAMTITKERLISYTKNQDFVVQTDNIKDNQENIVGAKVSFEIPYIYEN
jgi:tetratricopeptide (TPR) repeat protein